MTIWGPTVVAADGDDGHVNYSTGNWDERADNAYMSGSLFEVKFNNPDAGHGAVRFLNVAVPNGATINSATLRIYQNGAGASIDAVTSVIRVQVDVGAQRQNALSATHKPPSTNWTPSTAFVDLNGLNSTTGYRSITVTSLVQEAVNLGGWASGDELCFSLSPSGADNYWNVPIQDYDDVPGPVANLCELTIDYADGGGGAVIPATFMYYSRLRH